jgi:hypothetical protein
VITSVPEGLRSEHTLQRRRGLVHRGADSMSRVTSHTIFDVASQARQAHQAHQAHQANTACTSQYRSRCQQMRSYMDKQPPELHPTPSRGSLLLLTLHEALKDTSSVTQGFSPLACVARAFCLPKIGDRPSRVWQSILGFFFFFFFLLFFCCLLTWGILLLPQMRLSSPSPSSPHAGSQTFSLTGQDNISHITPQTSHLPPSPAHPAATM